MKTDALNQDDSDTPARSSDEILNRLFCLAANYRRFVAEFAPETETTDQVAAYIKSMLEWFESTGAADALSPVERTLVHKPPRTWTRQERLDASWRSECKAVMAWALGFMSLPPYDQKVDSDLLLELVDDGEPPEKLIRRARVRPVEELARAQEEAERWYWRATAASPYFESAQFGSPTRRAEMIRRAIGEEATLFGKEYALLSVEEFWTARSIARERLYALNWIWDGADWDDVIIDT
jgi:hypothetical protein